MTKPPSRIIAARLVGSIVDAANRSRVDGRWSICDVEVRAHWYHPRGSEPTHIEREYDARLGCDIVSESADSEIRALERLLALVER